VYSTGHHLEVSALRVVQWATGNIGTRSLQGIIDHPDLELVGLWVHSPDKAGRDAGDLCERPATGVVATGRLEEIVELGADCVVYAPRALSADEVAALLAGGANVVTTRGELHHPPSMDAALRAQIEAACAAGGTSIHSTGSSPGFITEAVPLVLASIQRRLDHLQIDEYADMSERPSPDLIFTIMGFGTPPAELSEGRLNHGLHSFGPSLRTTAEALGLPLDDLQASGAVAVAARDIEIAAGTVPVGTVAAQRTIVTGLHHGRPVIGFRSSWYVTEELEPAWDLRPTGWGITVEGDAPLDVQLRFPFGMEEMAARSPGYTANRAVNAIPYVCEAAPGIVTSVDLPQIIARLG
jgi:4-hydroxy-tetrahydrodipicolinate reductase